MDYHPSDRSLSYSISRSSSRTVSHSIIRLFSNSFSRFKSNLLFDYPELQEHAAAEEEAEAEEEYRVLPGQRQENAYSLSSHVKQRAAHAEA